MKEEIFFHFLIKQFALNFFCTESFTLCLKLKEANSAGVVFDNTSSPSVFLSTQTDLRCCFILRGNVLSGHERFTSRACSDYVQSVICSILFFIGYIFVYVFVKYVLEFARFCEV